LGHLVRAANPRKVRLIYSNPLKSDRVDAEWLARLVRFDAKLLSPIHHRSAEAQNDLAVLRSRDVLVRTRTGLVSHVRGLVKAAGARLQGCSTGSFHKRASQQLPAHLQPALQPVLATIADLTRQIRTIERTIEQLVRARYPHAGVLMQVQGVGPITALCYVLTLEDPNRFRKNRAVGPYLGLVPRRDQSGQHDPQMRITKAGDAHLRRLLVQCAQYILGPFGEDSDLRRLGLAMAQRGGRNAKKRAVVAVARRLAVLLLALWKTGEVYEPLRHAQAVKIPA
jgi:transposase